MNRLLVNDEYSSLHCSGRVVTQLTSDVGKVFSKLHLLPIEGKLDFCKGIKVANVSSFLQIC